MENEGPALESEGPSSPDEGLQFETVPGQARTFIPSRFRFGRAVAFRQPRGGRSSST